MADCQRLSFLANCLGLIEISLSVVMVGGCHRKRFKGNGNFLEGCEDGDFK